MQLIACAIFDLVIAYSRILFLAFYASSADQVRVAEIISLYSAVIFSYFLCLFLVNHASIIMNSVRNLSVLLFIRDFSVCFHCAVK